MLSDKQKQDLEDLFFLNDTPPDHLDDEELEYWSTLSQQWNQALSYMYQKISHCDNSCNRSKQFKNQNKI